MISATSDFCLCLPARNGINISSPSHIAEYSILAEWIISKDEEWSQHNYQAMYGGYHMDMPIWCIILICILILHSSHPNMLHLRLWRTEMSLEITLVKIYGKFHRWWQIQQQKSKQTANDTEVLIRIIDPRYHQMLMMIRPQIPFCCFKEKKRKRERRGEKGVMEVILDNFMPFCWFNLLKLPKYNNKRLLNLRFSCVKGTKMRV